MNIQSIKCRMCGKEIELVDYALAMDLDLCEKCGGDYSGYGEWKIRRIIKDEIKEAEEKWDEATKERDDGSWWHWHGYIHAKTETLHRLDFFKEMFDLDRRRKESRTK